MSYTEIISVVAGISILIFVLIAIYNIPSLVRSYRLAKVAQKLGLSFSDGRKNLLNPLVDISGVKRNIISGTINASHIEAYDLQDTIWQMGGNSITTHKWVLTVDDKEQRVPSLLGFLGLKTSVSKIKRQLMHF